MTEETLKIKLHHPDSKFPTQAYDDDVGYDVYAVDDGIPCFEKDLINGVEYLSYIDYSTGICIQPPPGYHIELFPRSSLSNYSLALCNSVGLVDNGYRGLLTFRFRPIFLMAKGGGMLTGKLYKKGDKIGQMVIRKTQHLKLEVVDVLSDTVRGSGGYGSSDKKEIKI